MIRLLLQNCVSSWSAAPACWLGCLSTHACFMIVWGSRITLETIWGLWFTHWDQNYDLLTRCSHSGTPIRPLVFVVPTRFLCSCWTLWCWELWVHESKGRHNMSWAAQGVLLSRRGVVLLIAPRTCESTSTQVWVCGNTKMWTVHQPSSLGDVQCLSFICIKACELFFVDIGEHRKRLIAIIGAPMGG